MAKVAPDRVRMVAKRMGITPGYVRTVLRQGTACEGTARLIAHYLEIAAGECLYGSAHKTEEGATPNNRGAAGKRRRPNLQ